MTDTLLRRDGLGDIEVCYRLSEDGVVGLELGPAGWEAR